MKNVLKVESDSQSQCVAKGLIPLLNTAESRSRVDETCHEYSFVTDAMVM